MTAPTIAACLIVKDEVQTLALGFRETEAKRPSSMTRLWSSSLATMTHPGEISS